MNSNLSAKRLFLSCCRDELALKRILRSSERSKYGDRYGVSKNLNTINFKTKVPIATYQDLQPYIERVFQGEKFVLSNENVEMWATSSGTSSIPKLIPYTKTFIRNYKRAEMRFFTNIFRRFPSILAGKTLIMTGRKRNYTAPNGILVGSASGLMADNIPSIFKKLIVGDPEELDAIDDDYRLSYLSQKAMAYDIRLVASSSSAFVLSLIEKTVAHVGINGIKKIWPKLKLICCPCGGYCKFQVERIEKILPFVEIWDTGFGSSEGFLSAPAGFSQPLGIPNSDLYYFELAPLNQEHPQDETISIDEAEQGTPYELIISATNGILRYRMNDIVSFRKVGGKKLLNYIGRTNIEISVQGERLTEDQVIEATKDAQARLGWNLSNFLFVPPREVERIPYSYLLIVPPINKVSDTVRWRLLRKEFCTFLDEKIQDANINYRNTRQIGNKLGPVELLVLDDADFAEIKRRLRRYSTFYGQGKEKCLYGVQEDDFYEGLKVHRNQFLDI